MIFANTFEYFFIAYEVVRMQRDPRRYTLRFWVWVAAVIWVVVKLPQEWWIHVAQLDFTDELAAHPWMGPTIVVALLVAAAVYWWYFRPRLSAPDWPLRFAADPIPAEMATWRQRADWTAANSAILSSITAEKVVLVGLISVIYGKALPGLDATSWSCSSGSARSSSSTPRSASGRAHADRPGQLGRRVRCADRDQRRAGCVGHAVLGGDRMDLPAALFFIAMLSLITLLHDRYLPVHAARVTSIASERSR